MAKVTNLTDRGVLLLRWRILPKNQGGVMDPSGNRVESVPADVAYSPQAKRLANKGILKIEGYGIKSPPVVPFVDPIDYSGGGSGDEASRKTQAASTDGSVRRRRGGGSSKKDGA